jgi:hypothetical protein
MTSLGSDDDGQLSPAVWVGSLQLKFSLDSSAFAICAQEPLLESERICGRNDEDLWVSLWVALGRTGGLLGIKRRRDRKV